MRRKLLIAVLALGTVGGYASGFASLRHCQKGRHQAFEQHVAKVCVDAARASDADHARAVQQAAPAQNAAPAQAPVIVNILPGAAQPAVQTAPAQPPQVQ